MEIGEELETITVEPIADPVPREHPEPEAPDPLPAEPAPEREPVTATWPRAAIGQVSADKPSVLRV